MPPAYPPYQQPLLDRATGHVSKPWQLFFLALARARGSMVRRSSTAVCRSSSWSHRRPALARPRHAGRRAGRAAAIGTGLALTGLTLSATGGGSSWEHGYWTPITNGDPLSPEILFDSAGDCIVGFVPTPAP